MRAASGALPEDAVLGVQPRLVAEVDTRAEAVDAMRSFAGDRLSVGFVGGGTDLELGSPPEGLDVLLRTRSLQRVVEYAPSDQIVAVEAGMTLASLQRMLAEKRQRLAIDPPQPERATIGGIVAANAFGPLRTRYGAMRDLVIGITIVRADGAVARGGGKVVKNVAGFDLPRLFCGSLGTLGLVAEVVLRLHPLPETSETVAFDGLTAGDSRTLAQKALDAALEPAAVVALRGTRGYTLAFRFEGFVPGVRAQRERLLAIAARPGEALDASSGSAFWARHDEVRTGGDVRLKAAFAPAQLEAAEAVLLPVLGALHDASTILYPTLGIAFVTGRLRDPDAAAAARAVDAARAAITREHRGSLVLHAAPIALRARTGVWGPPPPSIEIMRRLKRELDPERRLAPGRFVGGL